MTCTTLAAMMKMNKSVFTNELIRRRSTLNLWKILFVSICLISFQATSAQLNALNFCSPQDPSSCRYGGQCTTATAFPQLTGKFYPDKYLCYCEPISCADVDGYHPVCVSIGNVNITLVNNVCVRAEECRLQATVKKICNGRCGSSNCTAIEDDGLNCNEEDSVTYCFNYGTCRRTSSNSSDKHCKCLKGYTGHRCQNLSGRMPTISTTLAGTTENANYKLAFFVCAGLLLLLLMLQSIYCVVRCFGLKSKCKYFDQELRSSTEGANTVSTRMALEGVVVSGSSVKLDDPTITSKGVEQSKPV